MIENISDLELVEIPTNKYNQELPAEPIPQSNNKNQETRSATLEAIFDPGTGITQYKCPRCNQIWTTQFSNRKVSKPFNKNGLKAANDKIRQNCNPTDSKGNPRPLNLTDYDYPCRRLWVDTYLENIKASHRTSKASTKTISRCLKTQENVSAANWLKVQYLYADGITGVPGAVCVIENAQTGKEILRRNLDNDGWLYVTDIPPEVNYVNVYFDDDPQKFQPFEEDEEIQIKKYPSKAERKKSEVKSDVDKRTFTDFITPATDIGEDIPEDIKDIIRTLANEFISYDYNKKLLMGEWYETELSKFEEIMYIIYSISVGIIPIAGQVVIISDLLACLYKIVVEKRYDEWQIWFTLVILALCLSAPYLKGPIKQLGKIISTKLSKLWTKIGTIPTIEATKETFLEICSFMNKYGIGSVKKLLDEIIELGSKIPEMISKFEEIFERIAQKVGKKYSGLKESALNAKNAVSKMFNDIWNCIKTWIDDALSLKKRIKKIFSTRQIATVVQPAFASLKSGIPIKFLNSLISGLAECEIIVLRQLKPSAAKLQGVIGTVIKNHPVVWLKGSVQEGVVFIPHELNIKEIVRNGNKVYEVIINENFLTNMTDNAKNLLRKQADELIELLNTHNYSFAVNSETSTRYLLDDMKNLIVSDLDVMGAYKKIGEIVERLRNIDSSWRNRLNRMLEDFDLIKHGANDDQLLDLPELNNVVKYIPGEDEVFTIIMDGKTYLIEGMAKLKEFYSSIGIPWIYP
jgi:hypothetical protein